MADLLPHGFEDTQTFIGWACPTELERNVKRWSSTMDESWCFFDAVLARGPAAPEYLDQFDLAEIDIADLVLPNLCPALADCSAAIGMYENTRPKCVSPIERFLA